MGMTEERKKYLIDYQNKNLKRVPLNLKIEDYERLAQSAKAAGQSVNGYIKQAIAERQARES